MVSKGLILIQQPASLRGGPPSGLFEQYLKVLNWRGLLIANDTMSAREHLRSNRRRRSKLFASVVNKRAFYRCRFVKPQERSVSRIFVTRRDLIATAGLGASAPWHIGGRLRRGGDDCGKGDTISSAAVIFARCRPKRGKGVFYWAGVDGLLRGRFAKGGTG